jgi:hypothetical protein
MKNRKMSKPNRNDTSRYFGDLNAIGIESEIAFDGFNRGKRRLVGPHRVDPAFLVAGQGLGYAVMLGRAATDAYQRFDTAWPSGIGKLSAPVAKSTVTIAVMSAALNLSPATNDTSASLASRSA